MSISQHPDYAEETQYLSHTLQELEKTLKIMQKEHRICLSKSMKRIVR
ncbi:MAG: hypothetical protein ACLTDS_00885 [Bianqueaceae bacterium]